jgi:signal transduction histidine kinase
VAAERGWVAAGITLGGVVVALGVLTLLPHAGPIAGSLVPGLRSAALVLAIVFAVVCRLHHRATGLALGGRLQTSAWLLAGASGISLVGVELAVGPLLVWLRLALVVAAAAWVAWAVLGPEVEVPLRSGQELLVASVAVLVSWSLVMVLAPQALVERADLAAVAAGLMLALVWLSVAVIALVRSVAGSSVLVGWVAWLALALGVAELARFLTVLHHGEWVMLASSARVWGLLIATMGVTSHLARNVVDRRTDLHLAELRRLEQERQRHERERDHVHEIRNALFAIEAGTQTLERFRDDLEPAEREALAAAVANGLGNLRGLVEPQATREEACELWHLAATQAALIRARAVTVIVDGDEDVCATGDARLCTQILENLLANAIRHGDAAARGVVVEVTRDGDRALVRVCDQGPGIPAGDQERIFERGVRLSPECEGEGVGLPLARELARRQGGELWAERPASGVGACFVLALPHAQMVPDRDQIVDEAQHFGEVGQVYIFSSDR